MSALWTSLDIAAATGGEAIGHWSVNGLSIDTRSIKPGDLFVPLKDVRDGHDFIPMAYEKGAGGVISEHQIKDAPAVNVTSVQAALEDLAKAARARSKAKRIGVTGSVGKTSVKEMLAVICTAQGRTHASQKSFNNHWGVPLTLASMPKNAEYGVFEMGMNHAEELRGLTAIVKPDIAVITTVAAGHLEFFDSVDQIALAKAEILDGLDAGGIGIVNADNPYTRLIEDYAAQRGVRLLSFGTSEAAETRILSTAQTAAGSTSKIRVLGETITLNLNMAGAHWVSNAACALLVAAKAGIAPKAAAKALAGMHGIGGRGLTQNIKINGYAINLIDESYNANPASMAAAISVLGLSKGRKIAVLGDMLELGKNAKKIHADLAGPLNDSGIDLVFTCGQYMKALHAALPEKLRGAHTENSQELAVVLATELQADDVVSVKGSLGSKMSVIIEALKSLSAQSNGGEE